jgi:hypothetical protein
MPRAVADAQADAAIARSRLHQHVAAFAVVLDGVGQQVQQHLAQARGIAAGHAVDGAAAQPDLALAGQALDQRQGLGHQGGQRHRLGRDRNLPAFELGQVEHVVDQRQQMLAGRADLLQAPPARVGRHLLAIVQQQLREAQHGVQRRAQLVAHARQELRLGLALALRQRALFAGGLRVVHVGDIPVDADAPRQLALRIAHRGRPRGDPAPLPVGPAHAELVVRHPVLARRRVEQAPRALAVVGVHQRHALVGAQGLCARLQPAQPPHLLVPVGLPGQQVLLPGAHAGAARGQRRALAGLAQRRFRGAPRRDVHQHAEEVVVPGLRAPSARTGAPVRSAAWRTARARSGPARRRARRAARLAHRAAARGA